MAINHICSTSGNSVKNTGKKRQCLEKPFRTFYILRDGFKFSSVSIGTDVEEWEKAIKDKNVVPAYDIETIADNETAIVEKEGRFTTYPIKDAIAGSTYGMHLSICSHAALKTYENSGYSTIIRVTEDNFFECVVNDDKTVEGIPVTYFSVGTRREATDAEPPITEVSLKYGSYEASLLKADFDIATMDGVLDIDFEVTSATATEIKFKSIDNCSGSNIPVLEASNIRLVDSDGVVISTSFVTADANGEYTITGTGFATGNKLETVGVIDLSGDFYEGYTSITV